MTARWIPDDQELDTVARTLEAQPGDRAEQNRTAILAAAVSRKQQSRRSVAPYAIAGIALAAAASIAIWIAIRPAAQTTETAIATPKEVITPIGVARFERVTGWPDFVVRVDNGKIAVQVAKLEIGERFRVKTADAEIEVRGTKFDVGVETGRLAQVSVHEGRVEIRRTDQQVVVLSAGESWSPVQAVERDEVNPLAQPAQITPPPEQVASIDTPRATPPVHVSKPARAKSDVTPTPPPRAGVTNQPDLEPSPPHETKIDHGPQPVAAKPGEAEFRAGIASLRARDPAAATKSFAAACKSADNDAIGEDACFWFGAAAKRAGDTATARTSLARFLEKFPKSARAGEAAAVLGWIVFDAGELDRAEALFHQAEHDRVPSVRDSAERGLVAVQRKR